jgi:photosystem II stability/assembly factor-like uncharacterized protein
VYALIEAEKGGLYRSDDGGDSWSLASDHHAIRQRAWYYTTLTVDPSNPDILWFPQVPLLKSVDGGKTIKMVKGPHHGDHHDVWIDPQNPRRMIDGNDGGVDLSWDGGEKWYAPPLPISQFYHVSVDNSVPYRVMGAMQDLGTASGPSDSLASGDIVMGDWHEVGGGEAGHVVASSVDPGVVFAGEYLGIITRYEHRTGMARNVSIYPENGSGHGAEKMRYRFQWTAPIATSPHDPRVVYHGGNVLFRTTDGGQTWTPISGDLTRNDKSKQKWSGGPITGDNTGAEYYCTIFAVAESSLEKGLIWVGSDDGLVHVTRDGGSHWTNVTSGMKGIPEWGTVSLIEPSPHDAGTAYVVVDAHRLDDMRPYLYKTTDYGRSWKSLVSGLPKDVYLHAVREDPKRKGLLFLGTERGVSYSLDDGGSWKVLGLNLPTVAVHDLVVKGDDLVVGTHGRSIWILDDLTAIRAWTPEVAARAAHLFPAQPATRWEYRSPLYGDSAGENRPRGAILQYALKAKVEGEIKMEILDARGAVVRTITSTKEEPELPEDDPDGPWRARKESLLSTEPGVQRVVWDLRWQKGPKIKKAKVEGNPEAAPRVRPGTYTVRLTAAGQTLTTPLEVLPDPRLSVPAADLTAQVDFGRQVQEAVGRLTTLVEQVRSVRRQLAVRSEALQGTATASEWLKGAQDLITRCDALEDRLHNSKAQVDYDILAKGARLYSRLVPLLGFSIGGAGAPTQGMKDVFADQVRELEAGEAEWRSLVGERLAALERQGRELSLGGVVVPGAAAAGR